MAAYNAEKNRLTIERTFEALVKFVQKLDAEENRAIQEGLNEESLAVFHLLRKPDLTAKEIDRIKKVAVELLLTLKAEKLKIDHWQEKESTRDAVLITIRDYLWNEATGLLVESFADDEVREKADAVFRHVFRVYPTVPSPFYSQAS